MTLDPSARTSSRRPRTVPRWTLRTSFPLVPFDVRPVVIVLSVVVCFLLLRFRPRQAPSPLEGMASRLPFARHAVTPRPGPVLTITPRSVLLDGVRLAGPEALRVRLREARALSSVVRPAERFDGTWLIAVDRAVPWSSVKPWLDLGTEEGYVRPQLGAMMEAGLNVE